MAVAPAAVSLSARLKGHEHRWLVPIHLLTRLNWKFETVTPLIGLNFAENATGR